MEAANEQRAARSERGCACSKGAAAGFSCASLSLCVCVSVSFKCANKVTIRAELVGTKRDETPEYFPALSGAGCSPTPLPIPPLLLLVAYFELREECSMLHATSHSKYTCSRSLCPSLCLLLCLRLFSSLKVEMRVVLLPQCELGQFRDGYLYEHIHRYTCIYTSRQVCV